MASSRHSSVRVLRGFVVSRFPFLPVVILCLLMVLPMPRNPVLAQSGGGAGQALDLPGMELLPSDLRTAGLSDYASGVSAAGGGDTMRAFDVAYRGAIPGDPTMVPVTNLVRGAAIYLVSMADPGAPSPDRVLSSVYAFPDADAASAAYDAVVSGREGGEPAATPTDISDSRGAGTIFIGGEADPLGGAKYSQVSAVAVSDSLVVEVTQELTSGKDVAKSTVIDLLKMQLDRADQIRNQSAKGLGAHIPDISGAGLIPDLSRYIAVGSAPVPQFGLSEQDAQRQADTFNTYGVDEAYQLNIRTDDDRYAVGAIVTHHTGAEQARQYYDAIPSLLRGTTTYQDVQPSNDIIHLGTSAILITYEIRDVANIRVSELVVLDGDEVFEVLVNARSAVSTGDITTVGGAFTSCHNNQQCPSLVIPDDVQLGFPAPATPVA